MSALELYLRRFICTDQSTIGVLTIDGKPMSSGPTYTLEDKLRLDGIKVPHETAIPAGRYQIIVDFSPHFQRHMPLLLNVPNFDGIRIHSGNVPTDTDGCILVGKSRSVNAIWRSREAFNELFSAIVDALTIDNKEVWIEIANPLIK